MSAKFSGLLMLYVYGAPFKFALSYISAPIANQWTPSRESTGASCCYFPQRPVFAGQLKCCVTSASLENEIEPDYYVDKALSRRQKIQSTPLSQRWYKLRQRQITPAQRQTLRDLWPLYGVEIHYNSTLDLASASIARQPAKNTRRRIAAAAEPPPPPQCRRRRRSAAAAAAARPSASAAFALHFLPSAAAAAAAAD
jgi:hypothetical protein